MKWTGKGKYPPEQERERKRMLLEAREHEAKQRHLQAIRDKEDLFGEDSLDPEEKKLKAKHYEWFYSEEG